jgi:CBS domain-containing protein
METMAARHLLGKKVGLDVDSTGREIAYKFLSSGYPGLPVVDVRMEVIGVVTEYDLLGAIKAGTEMDDVVASKIMSGGPMTADIDTPVKKLIDMMIDNNLTVIPIVSSKRFVGVVSRQEIIEAHVDPFVRRLFED